VSPRISLPFPSLSLEGHWPDRPGNIGVLNRHLMIGRHEGRAHCTLYRQSGRQLYPGLLVVPILCDHIPSVMCPPRGFARARSIRGYPPAVGHLPALGLLVGGLEGGTATVTGRITRFSQTLPWYLISLFIVIWGFNIMKPGEAEHCKEQEPGFYYSVVIPWRFDGSTMKLLSSTRFRGK